MIEISLWWIVVDNEEMPLVVDGYYENEFLPTTQWEFFKEREFCQKKSVLFDKEAIVNSIF